MRSDQSGNEGIHTMFERNIARREKPQPARRCGDKNKNRTGFLIERKCHEWGVKCQLGHYLSECLPLIDKVQQLRDDLHGTQFTA